MKDTDRKKLAEAMRNFATQMRSAPIIGASVNVTGGVGGFTTGLEINVAPDPSGRPVTGMEISVQPGKVNGEREEAIKSLLAAADGLEAGTDPSLLSKMLGPLANVAASAGMRAAFDHIIADLMQG